MFHLFIMCVQRFCNFGNVLSLQKLDNDDITQIEQMAKNRFKDWLYENTDTINLIDYFGPIYHTKPDQFTFTCGDKKMILQLSEYVQLTVRRKGYEYFQGKSHRSTKNSMRHGTHNHDPSDDELQEDLYNGVLSLLQPYGDDVMSLFTKEMVVVTNENGDIKGCVRCVLCDTEMATGSKMKKRRKDFYSQYWTGQKWSLSNFANHHLQNVHPIAKNANEASKGSNIDEENIQTSHSSMSVGGLGNNPNIKNSNDKSMQHFKMSRNEKAIVSHFNFNSGIDGELEETTLNTQPSKHDESIADNYAANKVSTENDFNGLPLDDSSNNLNAENSMMIDKRM